LIKKIDAMKKMYVKPSMEVIEFCSKIAMQAASGGPSFEIGGGDNGTGEAESNDRRGGWGNLWN
jgi:hypothetical protein